MAWQSRGAHSMGVLQPRPHPAGRLPAKYQGWRRRLWGQPMPFPHAPASWPARGTSTDTPVQTDIDELAKYVNQHLTVETVNYIKASYPAEDWLTEFEANLAENIFSAYELKDIFLQACTDK